MDREQASAALVRYFVQLDAAPDGVTDSLKVTNCYHFIRAVVAADVPGDVVELGCYQGRTSVLMALTLLALGEKRRRLWLYDSFRGLPTPGWEDQPDGELPAFSSGDFAAPMNQCQAGLRTHTGKLPGVLGSTPPGTPVTLVPGWVPDTLPGSLPERIAFAYLDLDLYAPTLHGLRAVYDRLPPGGVVLLDDWQYERTPGVVAAVAEFLADKSESIERLPVPYQAFFVKG